MLGPAEVREAAQHRTASPPAMPCRPRSDAAGRVRLTQTALIFWPRYAYRDLGPRLPQLSKTISCCPHIVPNCLQVNLALLESTGISRAVAMLRTHRIDEVSKLAEGIVAKWRACAVSAACTCSQYPALQ